MEPDERRRRFRKLESAGKKVSIENRRLAREVIHLNTRLEKLEASVPRRSSSLRRATRWSPDFAGRS